MLTVKVEKRDTQDRNVKKEEKKEYSLAGWRKRNLRAGDSVVVWGGASLKLSSQDRSPRSGAGCSLLLEEQLYS